MKKLLLATALLTATFTSVSFADEMAKSKCDEATMTMVMDAIKKDTDPKMANDVKMATDEMMMADKSMKDSKMDDCSMHIDMAKKHMMMK
jgi:hypothetical protein